VFTTEWGSPLDQRRDWATFKALVVDAGLREARLHDLRHSAATLMLGSDTDLQTAGQTLGHSSTAQTAKYTHVVADRKAAAARMESLVWGTGNAR
jgi:site-specific recombinase XerD